MLFSLTKMKEIFLNILFALPVYQSVVLGVSLLISNRNKIGISRIILSIFQFLMAYYFTFNFLYSVQMYNWVTNAYFLIIPVILLFVPVFYLYILSVTTPDFILSKKHLLHFIPAFSVILLNTPYLLLNSNDQLLFVSRGYSMAGSSQTFTYLLSIYAMGLFLIFSLQLIVYTFKTIHLYKKHKLYISSRFSYTENINLDWLLSLIICFAIFFIFNDILYVIGFRQNIIIQISYIISMLVITYYIGYRGIKQHDIIEDNYDNEKVDETQEISLGLVENNITFRNYQNDPILNTEKESDDLIFNIDNIKKYSTSALSDSQKNDLIIRINALMEHDKFFTKNNLSVDDIAKSLETNSKYISQIINETYNKNFYNYINHFRIEEAKRMLVSDLNEKYSIMGIAQSVGFLSKSSFNTAFKKHTGLTPSEFKAQKA